MGYQGPVYVTLSRLEEKAYCSSKLTDPSEERTKTSKRLYHITAVGALAFGFDELFVVFVVEDDVELLRHY